MNEKNGDSRFKINPGEVQIFGADGKKIASNSDLKKRKFENTTFFEKLHVGDIVKLKRTGKNVVVLVVDYQEGNVKADYVGHLYNDEEEVFLFGQDDIEMKYSITIEEAKKMKGR